MTLVFVQKKNEGNADALQIEHQLSTDSLRLLQAQLLQLSTVSIETSSDMCMSAPAQDTPHSFAAELTLAATPDMYPSVTSVPARGQNAATAYLPTSDSGLMQPPPIRSRSLGSNALQPGLVRSHSLHALPCPSSTRMLTRPAMYEQDPTPFTGTSRASSAPGLALSQQQGLHQAKPQS